MSLPGVETRVTNLTQRLDQVEAHQESLYTAHLINVVMILCLGGMILFLSRKVAK